MTINVFPYGLLQLSNAGVGAALDPLLTDLAEETLDQIEPGRGGRREANVVAGGLIARPVPPGLVRAVVVHDQVDVLSASAPLHQWL